MSIGLVGLKSGMTRIFTEDGASVPVTVVEVKPNRVTQVKTPDVDGYSAVQVTMGERRGSRVSKGLAGHFARAKTPAGLGLWEFRAEESVTAGLETGSEIKVDVFSEGQLVDVTGTSKGKGFQGGVKRLMVTHCLTERRAPSDSAKLLAEFGRVRKWPGKWEMSALLLRVSR